MLNTCTTHKGALVFNGNNDKLILFYGDSFLFIDDDYNKIKKLGQVPLCVVQ